MSPDQRFGGHRPTTRARDLREALARLVRQAPAVVGVADPQTTYVVVDRRFEVVGALMSVYVSDAYVSGRVEADLDGTVTEVFEAS